MQLPNSSVWPGDGRRKKSKTGEECSYTTQLRLALETEEERRAKKGMDLDLIEIGVFKNKKKSRNELAHPVVGTVFLVIRNSP